MADNMLKLEIVTPEEVLVEEEASYVTIPGVMGELGILPSHVPLLTEIKSGVLSYKVGSSEKKVAIHHGFAQVFQDKISVLSKVAELSENIDIKRAQEAFKKADDKMKSSEADINVQHAKLMRSLTRQEITKKK